MFLNNVTIKTTIFSLFMSQIPRVNLAEVGSNTVSDVTQRILLHNWLIWGEWVSYNH